MKIVITESQLKQITEGMTFEEVYKDTFPIIFNLVCKKFAKGNYYLAQEYCQTGYVRVYNKLDSFRGEASITEWVRRVVTNEIINLLRKRTLDTNKDVDVEKLNITDEPIEKENEIEYMGKYSSKDIKNAIEDLADGYKFVFIRYYYSGKSHKEIADELGISEGTSRSQLDRARNNVKKYLENLKR
jgi:RNA polymerase sigma-70 factor (ECF subfamily)